MKTDPFYMTEVIKVLTQNKSCILYSCNIERKKQDFDFRPKIQAVFSSELCEKNSVPQNTQQHNPDFNFMRIKIQVHIMTFFIVQLYLCVKLSTNVQNPSEKHVCFIKTRFSFCLPSVVHQPQLSSGLVFVDPSFT